jgi:hypothetical protein
MGKKHPDLPSNTLEVFKLLAPKLEDFHHESDELSGLLSTLPEDRLDALGIGAFFWTPVYELTFQQHSLWVTYLIGKLDFVKAVSKANDPNGPFWKSSKPICLMTGMILPSFSGHLVCE